MKNFIFIIFVISILVTHQSCNSNGYFKVIHVDMPINTFTTTNNNFKTTSREDYYLVETNIEDSEVLKKNFTKYINKNLSNVSSAYQQYDIHFFKSNKQINTKIISDYPYDLRYKAFFEITPMCTYTWFEGTLSEIEQNF